jgi:hypothetical protein
VEATLEQVLAMASAYDPDDGTGYIVVYDYECPQEMHGSCPFAPIVKGEIEGVTKLYPTLEAQEGYVSSLGLLVRYLRKGVRVTKLHRVWAFDQSPYLREHFEYLGRVRAESAEPAIKQACKIAAVSVYGCTLENKRDRKGLALYLNPYKYELDVAKNWKPGHRAWVQYMDERTNTFVAYRERSIAKGVCLDTPRLVGWAVLMHAKCHMYDFDDTIRSICRHPPTLLYTDTDSMIYHFHGESCPYELMRRSPQTFDFKNGKYLGWMQTGREGTLGLFKNECFAETEDGEPCESVITEFVASEAKTYSYRTTTLVGRQRELLEDKPTTKRKGVPKSCVKQSVRLEDVYRAALGGEKHEVEFKAIRMSRTEPGHRTIKKVAFRGNNTKVCRLEDNSCVPLGHYKSQA